MTLPIIAISSLTLLIIGLAITASSLRRKKLEKTPSSIVIVPGYRTKKEKAKIM